MALEDNDSLEAETLMPPTSAISNEIGEIAVSRTTPPASPEMNSANGNLAEETQKREPYKVGKPQVVVRIRPTPNMEDNIFEVDQQTKTIQIKVERDMKASDPRHQSLQGTHSFIYFPADNVLENSSQEDTFKVVAEDLVEKAMEGISGIIVGVGPEGSGKSFSLFGLSGRYKNRGIAARTMEKLFEMKERKTGERDYRLGLGIIEVRRERIRDLLTLSPYEINDVGDHGPKGMYVEELDCLEHGIGILLRALIGQKLIHKQAFELYHTIMYLEIIGVSPIAPEIVQFRSRITLAEIAFAPQRQDSSIPDELMSSFSYASKPGGCDISAANDASKLKSKQKSLPTKKCGNPGYSTGPLAESIAVRRDVFALEQIFLKANETQRIRKYFSKLEALGLSMIASEKRKLSNSHNFRQSRLAHCLKDIVDGNTEIRILLHVMPNKSNLRSSLEAMRFAERARLVPSNSEFDGQKGKKGRTDEQILQQVISDIAPELVNPAHVESLSSEKMKAIQEQAVQYFENHIDSMKVCTKEKVKEMFENFRVLWNFLWEVELNVSLRKAEEEMRNAVDRDGLNYTTKRRSSTQGKDAGSTGLDDDMGGHYSKEFISGKKSTKKIRREKDKKKKKDKGKKDSQDFKTGSLMEQSEQQDALNNELAEEVSTPRSPEDEEEGVDIPAPPLEPSTIATDNKPPSPTNLSGKETAVPRSPESAKAGSLMERGNQVRDTSSPTSAKSFPNESNTEHSKASVGPGGGGFTDFKFGLRNSHDIAAQKELTEEERIAMAAKMEQIISDQFEEMKKVARRQAIHLLSAGVRRPQWMTLF